jgi:hypothetical protein
MRLLNLFVFTLFAGISFSQTTFFQLPETPVAPPAGTTSSISSDLMIAEDGRIYTAYIFNNGSNYQLYIEEYTGGVWTPIYQDYVYDDFEAIRSHKIGNDIYFAVKIDDNVAQDMVRIYKITGGTVGIVTSTLFSDIIEQGDFDFTISTSGLYGYMLHKDYNNLDLKLTQIDLGSGSSQSVAIPVPGNTFNYYDMVEVFDTVYVAYNGFSTSNNVYLYKIPGNMTGPFAFDGSAMAIIPGSSTVNPEELMVAYDGVANAISITTKTSTGNKRFTYNPATTGISANSSIFVSDVASPTVSLSELNTIYHFNNFTDGISGLPTTMVIQENLPLYDIDTVANYTFGGIGAQATNHRLKFSNNNKRLVASYFDVMSSSRKQFVTNEAPVVVPASIVPGSVCSNQDIVIFNNIGINEFNNDYLNIISINSSNSTACDGANLSWSLLPQVGNTQNFQIFGLVGASGSFDLTIEVTDGYDTITYTLPTITINTPTTPSFNTALIHVCSGNGIMDLDEYIDIPGGSYYVTALEVDYLDGFLDTDNSGLTVEQVFELSYETMINGCYVSAVTDIVAHDSPVITIATTPSTCTGNSGSAVATINGGTIPFTYQLWSNGEIGVTSVSNLAPGQYTFSIEDANTCKQTSIFDVPVTGSDATATIQNVLCNGQNNGSITLTTSGLTAPITYIWSTGQSVSNISNLQAGSYTVQLTDADNCVLTKTFNVTQPEPLVGEYNSSWPSCGLADGFMEVVAVNGGTAPYTYQWSTSDVGAVVSNVAFGLYSVTITDDNSCQTIKPFYMSEVGSADLLASITPASCGGNDGAINVDSYLLSGDPVQSISWSNGETTEDIANLAPANYICTLTTTGNCKAIKGWNIPIVSPELQPICVVTVDSATTTNLVVWEPVQAVGIAYYKIYRETSNFGEYILIDTVQATNTSIFNDVVASPIVRSWSYKISAVNGCETEGPLSNHHRTIHLNVTDAGSNMTQVTWNGYEGTTDYTEQKLWRYSFANDWELAATLPLGDFVFVDNIPFTTAGLDYMVELELNNGCSTEKAQDFNTTRSNKDKGQFVPGEGTGNSNNSIDEAYMSAITVYPNPANDYLNIAQLSANEMFVQVMDVNGKVLLQQTSNTLVNAIAINELAEGIYILELTIDNRKETRRFIKQ